MNKVRPTSVLLFTATLGYGGAEADFLRLAQFLSKRMPVTIVVMARDYGSADYSNAQSNTDFPIIVLGETLNGGSSVLAKGLRWLAMLSSLRKLKRQHDVTISFLSGPNLLNALAGRKYPSIVSERGSKLYHVGISPVAKWLWLRVLDPLTYRLAGRIVPVSVAYAEEIAAIAAPQFAYKIVPIEGGIDAALLINKAEAPVDEDIKAFCAAPTMVFCGRLDNGKGIDLLLPVFARVKRQHPEARLLIIGDGPLRAMLLSLCLRENLVVTDHGDPSADVFFAGYRADPMRHFRLCQLFCFPSLHEGLPNALIEAVASGIPIISADCPYGPGSILAGADVPPIQSEQLPRVLAHGMLLPLLTTSGGEAVWEAAIIEVLTQPVRRRSCEECCDAIARFDIETTGHHWVELIEALTLPANGANALNVLG